MLLNYADVRPIVCFISIIFFLSLVVNFMDGFLNLTVPLNVIEYMFCVYSYVRFNFSLEHVL